MFLGHFVQQPFVVNVITLFPELFPGPLGCSVVGKALENDVWHLNLFNLRDYAIDDRGSVDDRPFGGGAGMVICPEVVFAAISATKEKNANKSFRVIYPSPRGSIFNQSYANKLIEDSKEGITIICGRFEGVDQRVLDVLAIEEVSLGDFVMSSGDVAAFAFIDSCVRLLPNVVGNGETLEEESFSLGGGYVNLIEYPHYTRPYEWRGYKAPDVLLSGNHALIKKWRLQQAEFLTSMRRPDLWKKYKGG
jgi:tRNA (guanine37-N1)-methyltransferase